MLSSSLAVASAPGVPHRAMSPAPTRTAEGVKFCISPPRGVGETGAALSSDLPPHAASVTAIVAITPRRQQRPARRTPMFQGFMKVSPWIALVKALLHGSAVFL